MSRYNRDLLHDEKLFGIQHKKYSAESNMSTTHYHTHYEMYYQMAGDRHYFIKNKTYYVPEGSLVWLNLYDIHKTLQGNTTEGGRILLNFKKGFIEGIAHEQTELLLKGFSQENPIMTCNPMQRAQIEEILIKLIKEESNIFYTKILLGELLLLGNRYFEENETKKEEILPNKYERIAKITNYINENYSKKITLEKLAKEFYISPYYLSRTFKEGTGFNLITYLNYTRINKAKALIEETELNIAEISEKVGFESISHFNKIFKEIVEIPPLRYKRERKKLTEDLKKR